MLDELKWMVVWMERHFKDDQSEEVDDIDRWEVFDDIEDANAKYVAISLLETTYTASLVRILKSTDYHEEDDLGGFFEKGETKDTEFKSTLSLDLKTNKKEKYIQEAIIKTIAGFLNTDGGTLLIGVNDDNTPIGIDFEIEKLQWLCFHEIPSL